MNKQDWPLIPDDEPLLGLVRAINASVKQGHYSNNDICFQHFMSGWVDAENAGSKTEHHSEDYDTGWYMYHLFRAGMLRLPEDTQTVSGADRFNHDEKDWHLAAHLLHKDRKGTMFTRDFLKEVYKLGGGMRWCFDD